VNAERIANPRWSDWEKARPVSAASLGAVVVIAVRKNRTAS
jgi:hypothetical protein